MRIYAKYIQCNQRAFSMHGSVDLDFSKTPIRTSAVHDAKVAQIFVQWS